MIQFKRKSPKVLYITGWPGNGRGNGNLLTFKYLKDIGLDVIDVDVQYDKESADNIFAKINKTIKDNDIEMVVGLSTGGLFTACLKGVTKILINPCFNIGTFILFKPDVPIAISKNLIKYKDKIVVDNNTYGFFSDPDQVANSKEIFKKLYGEDKCFTIKKSQHVPRSYEWNEQILPILKKITGLKLEKISDIEFSEKPEKKTYAWVNGIRLPGFKWFPTTLFNLRLKYLKSQGFKFDDIKFEEK